MITIACVLRSGGDYDAEYVERLWHGVRGNLSLSHRFVCLSDVPVACERIPLVTRWPGWLAKLELFRPGLFEGTVVYLDLDTVITGPLDVIATHAHRFTMLSDFYAPQEPASGVMAWNGDYSRIFTGFGDHLVPAYRRLLPNRGDCGWIVSQIGHAPERMQELFPGRVVSYKGDRVAAAGVPDGAALVCFHGKPRPRDVGWQVRSRSSAPAPA